MKRSVIQSGSAARLAALSLALLAIAVPAQAQTPKVAQSGMTFLQIPIGARGAAMGYANAAVVNDASAFYWNPSAYAFIEGTSLFANRTQWIGDINVSAAAVSHNAGRWGIIGANITSVDWGTFNGTRRADNDAGYEDTGAFSPMSMALGVTYSYLISSGFGVGGNVKYLYERLGSGLVGSFGEPESVNAKMTLIAVDFGTTYYVGYHDLRIGVALRNFSNEKAYRVETFPLPMTFSVGMAMNVLNTVMPGTPHTFTVTSDFVHSRDYSERLHVGAEYGFQNLLFLRGGYKLNYDLESLSVGAGINIEMRGIQARVDYSYLQMDLFDGVNMLSVDFSF